MRGQKLLLLVILMSVAMTFLPVHSSYGEQLVEDTCTVQILVPGLKGIQFSHTMRSAESSDSTDLFLDFLFCQKENRERKDRKEHREDLEESDLPERLVYCLDLCMILAGSQRRG